MEECVVHTGEDGFPTVRHLTPRGTNQDVGAALTRVASTRHGLAARALQDADPSRACAQTDSTSESAPILWQRARGVARELGLEVPTCDSTALPYNQLPPGLAGPGCSLVYYPAPTTRSGHPRLSRNYDFPKGSAADIYDIDLPPEVRRSVRPFMADPYVLELHPADGGYASLAMVSFDLLTGTLDGINSEGLMMAVNGDEVSLREGMGPEPRGPGFHEFSCMREILDGRATAGEARALLQSARFYVAMVPCHYLVADQHGDAFAFERDANGSVHFVASGERPLVMTNHPLHRYPNRETFPQPHDVLSSGTTSFDRYIHLEDAVGRVAGRHGDDEMHEACATVAVSRVVEWISEPARRAVAAAPGLSRTLWHVVYDAGKRSMHIRFYSGETKKRDGTFEEQYGKRLTFTLGS